MNELLASLISSLQALTVLLAAQGGLVLPLTQSSTSIHNTPGQLSFTTINNLYRDTVVNILCKGSGKFASSTASGVVISPTGKIITNAHIAQYMLLEQATDATVSCRVRTGGPARDAYKATVLYLPESWVDKNAEQINRHEQMSTGQDDYAILQIIKISDTDSPLPSEFNYLQPDASALANKQGHSVLVRAYPAEFLGSNITLRSLNPVSTVTTIKEVVTFSDPNDTDIPTYDLISLGGTIVAQGGSSGGAVINGSGNLVGLIVTSTRKAETKDRNLKAITLTHINNSIKKNTGKSLDEFLSIPADNLSKEFSDNLLKSAQAFVDVYNK